LVTSAKDEELGHHMQELEAEDSVDGVVNSSSVENPKPAPDIFEEALRRAGATAKETVAVGDAVWDVEAAKAAGVRTVAVLTGGAFGAEELKEAGAIEVYEDCQALLNSGKPEWAG
jgi:phosphoglycolate phosphatase-like HAD superfamily hydrolase